MSLAMQPSASGPFHSIRVVTGTFSQISPVTSTPSISVTPTGTANAPITPAVVLCESAPTNSIPGCT